MSDELKRDIAAICEVYFNDRLKKPLTEKYIEAIVRMATAAYADNQPDNQAVFSGLWVFANELMDKAEPPTEQPDIKADAITFECWPVDENTPREESIWMNWPEFGWIRNSYYSCMGFYTWNYYSGHPGTKWIKENQPTHWTHAIPAPGGGT